MSSCNVKYECGSCRGAEQQVCTEALIKEKNFHGGSEGKQQSMIRCRGRIFFSAARSLYPLTRASFACLILFFFFVISIQ